jgi:hypothetical protein
LPAAPRSSTRSLRLRRLLAGAALAPVALAARWAQGAAFAPGTEADPPTGEVQVGEPTPEEPRRGNGVVWQLGPWRSAGALTVDLRTRRLDDGSHAGTQLVIADADWSTYIWRPWFVQLGFGLGALASRETGSDGDVATGLGLLGRAALSVFPASRFPFEARLEVGDSRTQGLGLTTDYRTRRVSITQGWRAPLGNESLSLQFDHSTLEAGEGRDRLAVLGATATAQYGPHRVELAASLSDHHADASDQETRQTSLSARHGFEPAPALHVDTLATWNETRLDGPEVDLTADVRQISSFASWRMAAGALFGRGGEPLLTATARWLQVRSGGSGGRTSAEAANASLGLNHELSPSLRLGLSGSVTRLNSGGGTTSTANASGSLGWTPPQVLLGEWRYGYSASTNLSLAHDSVQGGRHAAGLQGGHNLSRDWRLGETDRVALGFSQSLALMQESSTPGVARGLAHGASLGWQGSVAEGALAFASLSYSDALTDGETRGRFQLLNLQLSQRMALSRYSSWSVNFTAQAARNRASEIDPFTGLQRDTIADWQPFYSGSASYEHGRFLDVPRLRLSLLASATSQPLERRALGDIDAPRERVSASLEARLDWAAGRLETRLAARLAEVEGRTVGVLQARARRRF